MEKFITIMLLLATLIIGTIGSAIVSRADEVNKNYYVIVLNDQCANTKVATSSVWTNESDIKTFMNWYLNNNMTLATRWFLARINDGSIIQVLQANYSTIGCNFYKGYSIYTIGN